MDRCWSIIVAKAKFFVVVCCYVFFVAAGAKAENTLPLFSDAEIAEIYISIAFKGEFALADGTRRLTALTKRRIGHPVKVITFPQASTSIEDSFEIVHEVVDRLNVEFGGTKLVAFDIEQAVETINRGWVREEDKLADAILVIVGSPDELIVGIRNFVAQNITHTRGLLPSAESEIKKADPMLCVAFVAGLPGSTIPEIGPAYVWVQDGSRLRGCLYEEIMQSFGITYDFPAGTHSLFNDDNVYSEPTDLDWLLWRIHTDPRILAGMDENEARIAALQVIKENRK